MIIKIEIISIIEIEKIQLKKLNNFMRKLLKLLKTMEIFYSQYFLRFVLAGVIYVWFPSLFFWWTTVARKIGFDWKDHRMIEWELISILNIILIERNKYNLDTA